MYEVFEHTADLGLRVRGRDLSELFAEAARGLFDVLVRDLTTVRTTEQVEFRVAGTERAYLLLDWLSELLFAFETRAMLFRDFDITITSDGLVATASGERHDPARHELENEVKAVTYHGLDVRETKGGWEAEVILDI